MKKAVVILVVLAVAGAAGWEIRRRILAAGKDPSRRRGGGAVAVEVTPVRKATIRDLGLFTGSLQPKSQFVISPKIPGRLRKLMVNVGDLVKRDQPIALLDDEEYAQQVQEAEAEVEVVKAQAEESASALSAAQREYERAQALRTKMIASASELDTAEAQYKACLAKSKVATAQIAQKTAALRAAQIRLSYAEVRASWATGEGTRAIGERYVDEGALLKVNEPIVSILENLVLTASVHAIERDYPKLSVGQAATLRTDAFPDRTFTGRIVRIAPLLKESSRQAVVEIEIPNADRQLQPGMFIRAEIEFARHERATVIPRTALARRDEKEGVFLADAKAGKARFVPVTLGILGGELAEVTAPALEGLVVTIGHHLLEDGTAITLPKSAAAATSPAGAPASQPASRPGEVP